jgi:hypothetical protein
MDAPVSGSVAKAKLGTLAIMAGGDDAAFAKAEPVLRGMGEAIIRTGPVGSAHAMKALNNFVYAAGLLATAEALRMGEALNLDLSILADVLNASSGRNIATETKVKQEILPGRYAGGFQLGLMRKDLETAGAIAAETGFDARSLRSAARSGPMRSPHLGPRLTTRKSTASWTSGRRAERYSKIATARIGLAVPPRIFSGKPMKRNRPRPTSLSRFARHSMCVMPRSAQAMCAWKLARLPAPG